MTIEETIERLKNARSKCVSKLPEIQEMYDMFDKAIKALENQKTVVEELEKINDRLEVAMWYNRRDKEYCLELICKRISELKGENK